MLKYQELSLEMTRPDLNLSYSSRETPVVNSVKPHQETSLLDSKHGLILNLLVDVLDCMVDFTLLMLLRREIVLETPLQRLWLNLSKAISTQTQLQPAFRFPLKFCPPKDSMPEVHKAHSALVNAVKDNAAKDNEAKVDSEGHKDNEVKVDSEELKANVVKELKGSEEPQVTNKVLDKHNPLKTLLHFQLVAISWLAPQAPAL